MKTEKLEKRIVIELVLNYLGVEAERIHDYYCHHELSVSADVCNNYFFLDSEKVAFLRSIGINVDVEIEDSCVSIYSTFPCEVDGDLMDVECEGMSSLLCELFRGVFSLNKDEYETEGLITNDCLSVKITQKDGNDLTLDFFNIKALDKINIDSFIKPVNPTTAIVGFVLKK